jgi:cytochrome c oxidase assembly protein subunit 15
MKIALIVASCAAIGQISLGAIVIIERLHAVLVTIHLGLGLVLFSMMLISVSYSYRLDNKKSGTTLDSSSSSLRTPTANP